MKNKLSICGLIAVGVMTSQAHAVIENTTFPDTKTSYLKQFKKVEGLEAAKVRIGDNKDTVRMALGDPHFKEIISPTWNYWLGIYSPAKQDYQECQMRIDFNKKKVERISWKNPSCQDLLTHGGEKTIIVKEVKQPIIQTIVKEPKVIRLNTDGLFKFDSSTISDMNTKGYNDLQKLAFSINDIEKDIESIDVVGYTDRLGSEQYNYQLGLDRANAVKDFLLQHSDINTSAINVTSKGESESRTSCSETNRAKLIDCLAPDRHVDVTINYKPK